MRPIPRRHRAAASSLVTGWPSNRISPDPGARSPEISPNRLVLPAPLGPTMPTMSPAPTRSDSSSATTTLPKLFEIRSSSSRAVPAAASGTLPLRHDAAHALVGTRSAVMGTLGLSEWSTTCISNG